MDYSKLAVRYPAIHRRKVPFRPYAQVTPGFVQHARRIQELDFELERFVLSEGDYFELVQEAFASNIHFSTRLEGNPLPLAEVRRLTRETLRAGVTETRPSVPVQEILNHLALWLSPATINSNWNLQFILDTHRSLTLDVNPDAHPGTLRTTEVSIYTDSGQETFHACPARHVKEELESLLQWVNEAAPSLHPMAAAAVFYHEFESIHPFADGNGRVGRTLFHWFLQTHGLPNAHLCMVERELTRDPELYYQVLAHTDVTGSYGPLLEFFAECLVKSYEDAVERLLSKDLLSSAMNETAKRLVIRSKGQGWFSVQDASSWVTGVGDQTVRKHLNHLVEVGLLEATGRTKARRYRFVHPLDRVRRSVEELYGSLTRRGQGLHNNGASPTER